jgi:hypothetical protein
MKKRAQRGDPQREQQWQEVVRRWRKNRQSIREFRRTQGLKESAFYFWRRELARRGSAGAQRQEGAGRQPAGKTPRGERTSVPLRLRLG